MMEVFTISKLSCWYVLSAAAFVRIILISIFKDSLTRRAELVNPSTSWFRLQECNKLAEYDVLPYSGDLCHHPPLLICLMMRTHIHPPYLFLLMDALIALALFKTACEFIQIHLAKQTTEKQFYASDVGPLVLNEKKMQHIPITVMCFYLLNPLTIASSLAQSTEVITNLFISLTVLALVKHRYVLSSISIAISTYLSFYPIMLLSPLVLQIVSKSSAKVYHASKYTILTLLILCCIMWLSYLVFSSWDFIDAVYVFILKAPDLTPNMGLFWYLFAEMFDHFKLFYLWVYQLNVFIYLIPATIIFRKDPLIVSYILLTLTAIFKSYSNLGSVVVPLAMLPLWSYTFQYMRNVLLVSSFLLVTPILAPCMWYLWIYAGAGNANFFYAVTLAYNTGHIFLLSDVLYSWLRYQYHLVSGFVLKTAEGEAAVPILR